MSATGRGAERKENDFYETPAWCVHRLLEKLKLPAGRWIEPCAGSGAIIKAVESFGGDLVSWDAFDIDEKHGYEYALMMENRFIYQYFIEDFLKIDPKRLEGRVIITNPPYNLALDFFLKCWESDVTHIVFLLRLNWLASADRHAVLKDNVPDVYVLPNRPSFTGGKTDATEYAWFHWDRGAIGGGIDKTGLGAGTIKILNLTPKEVRCGKAR